MAVFTGSLFVPDKILKKKKKLSLQEFSVSPSILLLILQLCQQHVRINKISSRMLISSSFSLFPPLTYNNVGQRST